MHPQPAVRPLGPASGAASAGATAPASSPRAPSCPASTLVCLQPHRRWWTVLHSCLHHCCTAVPPLPCLLPLSLALLLAPFHRLPLPAAPPARIASAMYSCANAASSIASQLSPSPSSSHRPHQSRSSEPFQFSSQPRIHRPLTAAAALLTRPRPTLPPPHTALPPTRTRLPNAKLLRSLEIA